MSDFDFIDHYGDEEELGVNQVDADLVLLDPEESFVVRAAESSSAQGYTPFEGIDLKGRVKSTFLRGELICQEGKVLGEPRGKYLKRPYGQEPKV